MIFQKNVDYKTKKALKSSTVLNKQSLYDFYEFNSDKDVTIVIPSYNSESYISKCIDSIINQTYPFEKIEVIVVDDGSDDTTAQILKNYADSYKNIIVVLLKNNTGTPAIPRNIGIKLASAETIMFLDSDDWLAENGIRALYDTMMKNEDDFVAGKTMKVTEDKTTIHAEFISYKNRFSKHPLEIPYLLYHMGPPSKLMKTKIIKNNNILFPELKFAEDKSFFIQVLSFCNKVSTITEPICFINRYKTNDSTLTRSVSLEKKRIADLYTLKKVLKSKYDIEFEKEVVKRIIEYDLIRSCNSMIFLKSENQSVFFDIIRKAFDYIEGRTYNIIDEFDSPIYAGAAELIKNNQDEEALKLFNWLKTEQNKKIIVLESKPFFELPFFPESSSYKFIEIPIYAKTNTVCMEKDKYTEILGIFGEHIESASEIVIRDKSGKEKDLVFPLTISNNKAKISISLEDIKHLSKSLYGVYIRYNGYKLLTITRKLEQCAFGNFTMYLNDNEYIFYTTKLGNLGLSIRSKRR